MTNSYKEISYKWHNGLFTGRIYEFKGGKTIRHDKYNNFEEFREAVATSLEDPRPLP
jgi:hypothetical protein